MREKYNTKTNRAYARFVDAYYKQLNYELGVM